ncbi:hypothetical protein IF188_11565 [Microbacterium sp. NEAU-LLC]|uniref:2-isopropylmalate synthase LeuA allosteric (dimerisation) domain-containing protein n=1 Tax=Microbacterium helvum TaxID=2773713 RepID=A0ABR8NRY4_9MICO|nr:hypothetical protein [Microbacterium helvum]MBD3942336.1 hypothetical protein [Microbacterium helvum]
MHSDDIHRLELTPLADRSWRLCDSSVAGTDATSVVAYVELHDDGVYEVVWVSVGIGSARFLTLESLFRAALRLLEQSVSFGPFKPSPIPHRPPAHA